MLENSGSQLGTGRPDSDVVPGRYDGVASILSTTGWCSVSSAGLSTNSRSDRPSCSSRQISLAMNSSEMRG